MLARPVGVGDWTKVSGTCLSENVWLGVAADPLPRISATDMPCVASPTLAFTVVAVRS